MGKSHATEQKLLDMAERAGRDGFVVNALAGISYRDGARHLYNVCQRLISEGRLYRGKIGRRTMRLFARAQWAADFEATRRAPAPANNKSTLGPCAPWGPDTPAIYPVDADGKPLYKITICPSKFDAFEAQNRNRSRWNADPIMPLSGGVL